MVMNYRNETGDIKPKRGRPRKGEVRPPKPAVEKRRPQGIKRFYAALANHEPGGDVDLTGLRRFARKDGGGYHITKAELLRRKRAYRAQVKAKERAKAERKREWKREIAKRIGKGRIVKLQAANHRGTGESPRQPVGVYETDRECLAVMQPHGWQPASVAGRSLEYVVVTRLFPAGLVERMNTGGVSSPGRPTVFWRLTDAGRELRSRLNAGYLPERVAVRSFIPLEAGEIPGHRKTLCSMTPEAWQAIREVCGEGRGVLADRTRGALLRLMREGLVERAANEEVLGWWKPGEQGQSLPTGTETGTGLIAERAKRMSTPRWLWRLTERGVEVRAQWLSEDRGFSVDSFSPIDIIE